MGLTMLAIVAKLPKSSQKIRKKAVKERSSASVVAIIKNSCVLSYTHLAYIHSKSLWKVLPSSSYLAKTSIVQISGEKIDKKSIGKISFSSKLKF